MLRAPGRSPSWSASSSSTRFSWRCCAARRRGSMFRRIVMPAVALAALAAMLFVVLPAGAIGNEHASTRSGAADRYAFGRDIDVTAPVVGSVQAYGGSVDIEELIEGDLLVF